MASLLDTLKQNWKSGITVSLVSLPLSVSLAVASQTTPVVGILTAIWAGLIASLLGGSHFNIVGPTGALSGMLATVAITYGAGVLPVLAVMTGLIVTVAYVMHIEKYLVFVPASTIHGFTLGVAAIIALNQLNALLGITGLPIHERLVENVVETVHHLHLAQPMTVLVFSAFLVGLLGIARYAPYLPGAIVLAPVGILIGYLSTIGVLGFSLQTLGMKYSDITPTLFIPTSWHFDPRLISVATVVAFVAILETMISAKIADGMTKTKHHKRKELLALGMANVVSGLAGGMPATAALARTSLNISSGATHKFSATISSISIALISFLFLRSFTYIPMAVIAAILVHVAWRMIEMEHFKKMFTIDKVSFSLAMLVGVITVYEDPTVGILFGVAASLLLFVEKLSKGQFTLIANSKKQGVTDKIVGYGDDDHQLKIAADTIVYSFKGQLAYINGQSHLARFETGFGVDYTHIILRFRSVYFIDLDGVDVLQEIIEHEEEKGKKVFLTGISPFILSVLEETSCYKHLKKKDRVYDKTTEALAAAGYHLSP